MMSFKEVLFRLHMHLLTSLSRGNLVDGVPRAASRTLDLVLDNFQISSCVIVSVDQVTAELVFYLNSNSVGRRISSDFASKLFGKFHIGNKDNS